MESDGVVAEEVERPRKTLRRKKNKLSNYVIVTETDLEKKTTKGFEFNRETKEFYTLKEKCKKCDSLALIPPPSSISTQSENSTIAVSTASTTSTTTTCAGSNESVAKVATTHFDEDWLSENDNKILGKIAFEEEGHHRRMVRQHDETLKRQQTNKINMLSALRIQNTTRNALDRLIQEALDRESTSVNLNAFLIMQDGSFVPYNIARGGVLYETCRNKHTPIHIDRRQLFVDMMHHQEEFKQLLHIFQYLDNPPEDKGWAKNDKLPCVIYKRKIELVDMHLIDTMDMWDRLECLFDPNLMGFYYAIIVCFGLFTSQHDTTTI